MAMGMGPGHLQRAGFLVRQYRVLYSFVDSRHLLATLRIQNAQEITHLLSSFSAIFYRSQCNEARPLDLGQRQSSFLLVCRLHSARSLFPGALVQAKIEAAMD